MSVMRAPSGDATVTVDAPDDDGRLADPYQLEIHPLWARTGPPSTAKLRRVSSLWSPVTTTTSKSYRDTTPYRDLAQLPHNRLASVLTTRPLPWRPPHSPVVAGLLVCPLRGHLLGYACGALRPAYGRMSFRPSGFRV